MKKEFVLQMQSFVAETCFGASALRGKGRKGLLKKSREFFKTINLNAIPQNDAKFASWLDDQTDALLIKYRKSRKDYFALARKALNLFLRSAAYNCCLNQAYKLDSLHSRLEVPLDSYVGKALRNERPNENLPRWSGLKKVTPELNKKFQNTASNVAMAKSVNRVDLDVFYYRKKAGET